MCNASVFPFYNLGDSEFLACIGDGDRLCFEHYNSLIFDVDEVSSLLDSNVEGPNVVYADINCNYYELCDFLSLNDSISRNKENKIMYLFLNIRSMSKNFDEFCSDYMLDNSEFDFMCFTETRITDSIAQLYELPHHRMAYVSRCEWRRGYYLRK